MNDLRAAISAEFLKLYKALTFRSVFIAFAIAPVMGAVFVVIARSPGTLSTGSALHLKMQMLGFSGNWSSYCSLLNQAAGVGGILLFGFAASWLFGREYSEGTAKDLLSLPVSRAAILNAKFLLFFAWCGLLALANLLLSLLFALLLGLPVPLETLPSQLYSYFGSALLAAMACTPIAFFALAGKGYLAPLGFVGLTLVFSQVIAALGYGNYFPWAIPGIYSGSAGEYRDQLNAWSFTILLITALAGYFSALAFWKYADHHK